MKKVAFLFIVFQAAVLNAQSSGSTLYVAVKSVELKSSSVFFASVVGTVGKGEEVTVIQSGEKWIHVRNASGLEGYAPVDAFSVRRILASDAAVSATEFAMAGKGFSDDLEQLVRSSGDVDYSAVDAMEQRVVSPEELRAFLTEGRLAMGE
jgi:uncharacterized protein YgiM (DUF1202 family)